VGTRRRLLTQDELARPFREELGQQYPPILSPLRLADLLGRSPKTIYAWIAQGRLDGTFRKRGKHILIWRDKALDQIFNGPPWSEADE
jgi:hypothetical protein